MLALITSRKYNLKTIVFVRKDDLFYPIYQSMILTAEMLFYVYLTAFPPLFLRYLFPHPPIYSFLPKPLHSQFHFLLLPLEYADSCSHSIFFNPVTLFSHKITAFLCSIIHKSHAGSNPRMALALSLLNVFILTVFLLHHTSLFQYISDFKTISYVIAYTIIPDISSKSPIHVTSLNIICIISIFHKTSVVPVDFTALNVVPFACILS